MAANAQSLASPSNPSSAALCSKPALAYAQAMAHSPDDSALMLRYGDGDVQAFEILYRRHKDAIYRYLLRLSGHRDSAEDIFQDVWGKIVKARESYRPTAKFTTFLYRVAHNCFIDYVRRNKRHSTNTALEPELHSDPGESVEMETERHLARERLEIALGTLPEEQRDAFLLHEEGGLSVDQIGKRQKVDFAMPWPSCGTRSTNRQNDHDYRIEPQRPTRFRGLPGPGNGRDSTRAGPQDSGDGGQQVALALRDGQGMGQAGRMGRNHWLEPRNRARDFAAQVRDYAATRCR